MTTMLVLLAMPAGAWAGDCGAGLRHAQVAVASSGLVVVPFAVPVAVPVATIQAPAVLYSWRGAASTSVMSDAAGESAAVQEALGGEGLVRQRCARCHEGEAAKGDLVLTDLGALSAEQRLEAVRRVVSDDPQVRMPRGMLLSPSEIGRMVQELSERSR
ncbi:MAG: hypothetical protein K1X74_00635 [Pirellulales bacterium]|nr:hypothetical protein [Pirellulales bacterium]